MESVARYVLWEYRGTGHKRCYKRAASSIEKSLRQTGYRVVRWHGHKRTRVTAWFYQRMRKVM